MHGDELEDTKDHCGSSHGVGLLLLSSRRERATSTFLLGYFVFFTGKVGMLDRDVSPDCLH